MSDERNLIEKWQRLPSETRGIIVAKLLEEAAACMRLSERAVETEHEDVVAHGHRVQRVADAFVLAMGVLEMTRDASVSFPEGE